MTIGRTKLTAVKKGEICAIVAMGCSRAVASRYVGCCTDTIRRAALKDEPFAMALRQAESRHEVLQLSYINKAAKDARYWRAAAWALERRYPARYGERKPHLFTIEQVAHVLAQFADTILEEIPKAPDRRRILRRLKDLSAGLQASVSRQGGRK